MQGLSWDWRSILIDHIRSMLYSSYKVLFLPTFKMPLSRFKMTTFFMKNLIFNLSLLFVVFNLNAQSSNSDVLFKVADEAVTVDEFLRVYNKNLDLVKDESQKDIDAYLKLYIDYKLKIHEAKRLGLDEKPSYKKEFANYKKQLTQNFLSDNQVTEDLIKEAYERSVQDVKASHILIRTDGTETDTTEVYNRLMTLRDRVLDEGYPAVQKEIHDGKTVFAEDLGYFSTFKMVYPFETMAYNTNVGEVSLPFKTQFGYHVVYVQDKRPSLGQVTVAHIMVSDNQKDSTSVPEKRIRDIYQKIEQGESFEALAKQFSDDKSSSARGGALSPFSGGQLSSQEFEEVAFSLTQKDALSKPFKTDYGWHIVKLLDKKGVPSFEESRPELEQKIKRDSRSKLINSALADTLKNRYTIKKNDDALSDFSKLIDASFFTNNWKKPSSIDSTKVVFKIKDQDYSYPEFFQYLSKAQRAYTLQKGTISDILEKELDAFLESSILKYHEEHLEEENPEFGFVVNEYREGLLLFDLMEQEIWNAAAKDSTGLQEFYDQHKSDYKWLKRVEGSVLTSASKEVLKKAEKLLKKSKSVDDIISTLNSESQQNILATPIEWEADNERLPQGFEFKTGISEIYSHNDAYHIFVIEKVLPESTKAIEEARGQIVGDYQNELERRWLMELGERYEVTINQDVLDKVKSKIQN